MVTHLAHALFGFLIIYIGLHAPTLYCYIDALLIVLIAYYYVFAMSQPMCYILYSYITSYGPVYNFITVT